MRKLLLVSSKFEPSRGGVEQVVKNISEGLSSKYDIKVLTSVYRTKSPGIRNIVEFLSEAITHPFVHLKALFGSNRMKDGYQISETVFIFFGITFLRSVLTVFLFPFSLIHFIYQLYITKPDIVHFHFMDNIAVYSLITKLCVPKATLIISFHGNDINGFVKNSTLHRVVVNHSVKVADRIIFNSNYLYTQAKDFLSIDKKKVDIVPNSVPDKLFLQNSTKKEKSDYIFFVGRLVYKKGVDVLINAFKKVSKNHTNLRLIIAGGGKEEGDLKLMSEGHKVVFLGPLNNPKVISYIDDSMMMITPSRQESFGIVNIEAFARQTPVIASKVGGMEEYMVDGENCLLFESENTDELAQKIEYLLKHDERAKELSSNAYNQAKELFSQTQVLKMYSKIYEE